MVGNRSRIWMHNSLAASHPPKPDLLPHTVILSVFTSIYIYIHPYEVQFKSICFALILWKLPGLGISKSNPEKHEIDYSFMI